MANSPVFLDANVLVYALDATSEHHAGAVRCLQQLLADGVLLCTSHHVVEEVAHIARKIGNTPARKVIKEIGKIPGLVLVEPDAVLAFAERYAALSDRLNLGINDALLLQLMCDAGITKLFSYDGQFVQRAKALGIDQVADLA